MNQSVKYENGKLVLELDVIIRLPISVQPVGGHECDDLTPRERQVCEGIIQGKCNKEIANELDISVTTVKFHVQSVLKKLGVSSRLQILASARQSPEAQLNDPAK